MVYSACLLLSAIPHGLFIEFEIPYVLRFNFASLFSHSALPICRKLPPVLGVFRRTILSSDTSVQIRCGTYTPIKSDLNCLPISWFLQCVLLGGSRIGITVRFLYLLNYACLPSRGGVSRFYEVHKPNNWQFAYNHC